MTPLCHCGHARSRHEEDGCCSYETVDEHEVRFDTSNRYGLHGEGPAAGEFYWCPCAKYSANDGPKVVRLKKRSESA